MGVLPVIAVMGAAFATAMNSTPDSPIAPTFSAWVPSERGAGTLPASWSRFSLVVTDVRPSCRGPVLPTRPRRRGPVLRRTWRNGPKALPVDRRGRAWTPAGGAGHDRRSGVTQVTRCAHRGSRTPGTQALPG